MKAESAKPVTDARLRPTLPVVFLWLTLFAIAFAWVESAVVHYLHIHFYPGGFSFPLVRWEMKLVLVETGREISTIIVLIAMAYFAATGWWRRFAFFIFCFGVWDIFYYLWLVLFERWPESLFAPDLLFLVPVPWAAPVLAPVLVSVFLIITAVVIVLSEERAGRFAPNWAHILLVSAAWALILVSFLLDSAKIIETGETGPYRWDIFLFGLLLWAAPLIKLGVAASLKAEGKPPS
jgi:hypothetical protein